LVVENATSKSGNWSGLSFLSLCHQFLKPFLFESNVPTWC
jgi:hypothetical protein